ncbi:hypothetical protein ACWKSP_20810 [Micromonosporaceae bacterium Da 78-11]
MTAPRYDRAAASQILADLAHPRMFADITTGRPRTILYAAHVVSPEPGSHLTVPQRLYLEKFMRPCLPAQVTAASHRIT